MEHFLEAAQCQQNDMIHHNITGKTRSGSLLFSQAWLRPLYSSRTGCTSPSL